MEDLKSGNPTNSKPLFTVCNDLDERLSKITNSIVYPVINTGSSVSAYKAQASSASSSGISFNVILPSQDTVLSPMVLMESQITFNLSSSPATFAIGTNASFCSFPLNEMFDTEIVTLNSSAYSFEKAQNLPILKQTMSKEMLEMCAQYCPVGRSVLKNFADGVGTIYDTITDLSGQSNELHSNGKWVYDSVYTPDTDATKPSTLAVTFLEPLLNPLFQISDKIFGEGGYTGLRTLRTTHNFKNSNWKSLQILKSLNCTVTSVTTNIPTTHLHLFYITPSPIQTIPRRNIHLFDDIIRGFTPVPNGSIKDGMVVPVQAMSFGYMPKSFIIACRKPIYSLNNDCTVAYNYIPISGCNFTLNNKSGQLSNCSMAQLYQISVRNGLSNIDFQNYKGVMNKIGAKVPTCGSCIIVDVGRDLVVDPEYAPGSRGGPFNFYGSVTLSVPVAVVGTEGDYELVVLAKSTGLVITELGSTEIYNDLLTKDLVLSASQEKPNNQELSTVFGEGGNNTAWVDKYKNVNGGGYASGRASGHASGKLSQYLKK